MQKKRKKQILMFKLKVKIKYRQIKIYKQQIIKNKTFKQLRNFNQ